MPTVTDMLARLTGAKFMAKLDAKTAFWQLPLAPESRRYTGFASVSGSYQYCRVPMGHCGSAQALQRFMASLLNGIDSAMVYIDDVVVFGDSWQRFRATLKAVTDRMRRVGLILNGAKCVWVSQQIRILGHVVSPDGIQPDPKKVEALVQMPAPRSKSELRAVLGAASWLRRFIPSFASITAPLTALLANDTVFKWSNEASTCFGRLKQALMDVVMLRHPDFGREFIVRTDASKAGVGAVLAQRDDTGAIRPVAYYSRKFTTAEGHYDTREQELLGVVCAVKHFHEYLQPHPFLLMTDHANLLWLWRQADVSGRLARWILCLQQYQFRVVHTPGTALPDADMLSRVLAISAPPVVLPTMEEIEAAQRSDVAFLDSVQSVSKIQRQGVVHTVVNGRMVPIIPPGELRQRLLAAAHVLHGHPGWKTTWRRLRKAAYWPGQARDVQDYVRRCTACMKTSAQPVSQGLMGAIPVTHPWQLVAMDTVGP